MVNMNEVKSNKDYNPEMHSAEHILKSNNGKNVQ